MKKIKSTTILFFLLNYTVFAFKSDVENMSYHQNKNLDASISSIGNNSLLSISYNNFHSVTPNKKFKLGYGIRLSTQFGSNTNYTTAPAKLTSKQQGPQVLFSETYSENIDTFSIAKSQNNAINISLYLQYSVSKKLDIGFNIDAVGFTFGAETEGKYLAYKSNENSTTHNLKPTTLNLLLISDNDIGTLNSELYARYWLNNKWAIKGGVSFLFTEYTSHKKLRLDNDRFRNKALLPMIGVTYTFSK
jgi:hypothetical protein